MKIEGLDALIADLEKIESDATTGGKSVLRKYAKKITKTAKSNALTKDGYLEKSINILEEKDTPNHLSIELGVDEKKLGPGYTKDGFDYHVKVNDGDYEKLGPRSQSKRDSGHDVGPHFVDRALWEHTDDMIVEIEKAVKDALK